MKEFYIAGVQHHKSHEAINEVKVGSTLEMTPEPTNPYDANAVALNFLGDIKLTMFGYVPAKFSPEITADLEIHGKSLECIVTELNPAAKPWERIKVKIWTEEEAFEDDYNQRNEEY